MRLLNSMEYKHGIVVNHNPYAKKFGGPCFFIPFKKIIVEHLVAQQWDEEEILDILKWLREDRNPLLIQFQKRR